jgi:murein DD-endopeptidase MepM/ murein hydrolase activator NlpD
VKEGDVIAQNQVIALSGGAIGTKGAGRLTTGPHLHFEILKDGKYVNPMEFLVQFDL